MTTPAPPYPRYNRSLRSDADLQGTPLRVLGPRLGTLRGPDSRRSLSSCSSTVSSSTGVLSSIAYIRDKTRSLLRRKIHHVSTEQRMPGAESGLGGARGSRLRPTVPVAEARARAASGRSSWTNWGVDGLCLSVLLRCSEA
eukprot:1043941-Rhodomonas_salina.2